MTVLLIYATLSIIFSFLCSILEAVLLSVTPTFVKVKKSEGKAYANDLEKLKEDVDKPLIAILTVNTFAHTVGAILVGSEAKKAFGDEGNGVFIVSAVMTVLILVASEIIPKTIGATYWKYLAAFATKALTVLIFIGTYTGIIWILQRVTKLFGKGGHVQSVLSREDFTAMADIAEQEGVFHKNESNVIRNMIRLKEVQAEHIMTPRTVVKLAHENQTIQSFFDENQPLQFSRIPVYGENIDTITGYFLKDELLLAIIDGKGEAPLKSLRRNIMIANKNLAIPNLFDQLITQKEHLALVVDTFGAVSGVVTQEDVIETLLGFEILDESDHVADLQRFARKNWEQRAQRLGIITKEEG